MDDRCESVLKQARKKAPKDYSRILPFMAPPVPSQSGRTAPELAYKAMGEAIEGMKPSDLRKLAPLISFWKDLDFGRRFILRECAFYLRNEQEEDEAMWKLEREHPVIVFAEAKKRLR